MTKIKGKSKIFFIIFAAIDVLLIIATIALLIFSIIFGGSLAPKLFSHRVYLMETDAFSLVESGSALIAQEVDFNEIVPGNIILFTDESEKTRVGEVQQAKSENGVYTYTVKNDTDIELTVGQSRILGKGIYYSKIIGLLISFVTSPAGICCLAIFPCAAFVIFEFVGAARRKAPLPNVQTVKKQDEIPTYIPPYANAGKGGADSLPIEERPAFSDDGRQRLMEAAGLYTPTPKKPEPEKQPALERRPILEKDIDKLIRETKAKHKNDAFIPAKEVESAGKRSPSASAPAPQKENVHFSAAAKAAYEQAQSRYSGVAEPKPEYSVSNSMKDDIIDGFEKEEEPVKRPEPPKRPSSRVSPRVSRLDSLLKEETSNSRYDINDILKNIDGK